MWSNGQTYGMHLQTRWKNESRTWVSPEPDLWHDDLSRLGRLHHCPWAACISALHLTQLGQALRLVRRYVFDPVMDLGAGTKSIWAAAVTKTREMKELGGASENHVVPSERWWVLWVTSHFWEAGPGMHPLSIFYPWKLNSQFPKLAAQLNEMWLSEGHI